MSRVCAWSAAGAMVLGAIVSCSQGAPSVIDTANNDVIDASTARDAGTHKDAGTSKDAAATDATTGGAGDASDAASVEGGDGAALADASEPGE